MNEKAGSYLSLATKDPVLDPLPAESTSNVRKVVMEFLIAVGVSVSWACGRQFTKTALVIEPEHFYAPYFLMWFNTCFMIVCYPVFLLYNRIFNAKSVVDSHSNAQQIFGSNGMTWSSFFAREMPFVFLWVVANYSYSQALGYISASAALVIVSANVAVVCVLERIFLKEAFTVVKVIAAILALAGLVLSSMDEQFSGSVLGIFLVVICAVAVAFYKVLFKVFNGNANLGQTSLFMSGLGAINLLLNVIPTILLTLFGVERLEWSYIPWTPLIFAAVLSLIFNFLTNFGIALLGPFAISVGMLLGIPMSTAIDVILRSMSVSGEFLAGSLAISLSFVLVVFPVNGCFGRLRRTKSTSMP